MKTGKITAKLRDAVPVCLIVEGKEVKRYKNIELPDAIKEIEMRDFHFYIPQDGRITFQIHYEKGALPDVFPAPRAKMTRAEKAAARAAAQTEMEQAETAPKEQEAPCTVQEPKEITALAVIRPLDMADLIAAPHTETTAAEIPEENIQEAEAWIKETLGSDSIHASRLQTIGTSNGGSKKSQNCSIKYICPCCGTIIRATRRVNVICADCNEAFEPE